MVLHLSRWYSWLTYRYFCLRLPLTTICVRSTQASLFHLGFNDVLGTCWLESCWYWANILLQWSPHLHIALWTVPSSLLSLRFSSMCWIDNSSVIVLLFGKYEVKFRNIIRLRVHMLVFYRAWSRELFWSHIWSSQMVEIDTEYVFLSCMRYHIVFHDLFEISRCFFCFYRFRRLPS